MDLFKIFEWVSAACGLLYVILIMRQNIWCWLSGILSSVFAIILLFHSKLYLEGSLNFYYVITGIYGWVLWQRRNNQSSQELTVTEKRVIFHILNTAICIGLTFLLGRIMQRYTDSPRPFFDAALTVFSFSATILEARKILSAWIYWTVINGASIVLMVDRGMYVYAILSFIMTTLSVKGYFDWKKSMNHN